MRRVVTIVSSLALLQLVLLGSALPCVTDSADVPHAGHEASHDVAPVDSPSAGATHDAPDDTAPRVNCELLACTVTPALVAGRVTIAAATPLDAVQYPPAATAAASPIYSLDPPPPRA